ncbi:MAG: hypothetical protein LBP39_02520 [Rickettsiales bacterium]|jgi:hypothetical protein|nr:hypothetical protein [Rickettsiales bacterium]
MFKKEGKDNIINLSKFISIDEDDNIEAVPHLNNNGDEMQDILSEVENNTRNLRKDFIPGINGKNVIKINFNRNNIE